MGRKTGGSQGGGARHGRCGRPTRMARGHPPAISVSGPPGVGRPFLEPVGCGGHVGKLWGNNGVSSGRGGGAEGGPKGLFGGFLDLDVPFNPSSQMPGPGLGQHRAGQAGQAWLAVPAGPSGRDLWWPVVKWREIIYFDTLAPDPEQTRNHPRSALLIHTTLTLSPPPNPHNPILLPANTPHSSSSS